MKMLLVIISLIFSLSTVGCNVNSTTQDTDTQASGYNITIIPIKMTPSSETTNSGWKKIRVDYIIENYGEQRFSWDRDHEATVETKEGINYPLVLEISAISVPSMFRYVGSVTGKGVSSPYFTIEVAEQTTPVIIKSRKFGDIDLTNLSEDYASKFTFPTDLPKSTFSRFGGPFMINDDVELEITIMIKDNKLTVTHNFVNKNIGQDAIGNYTCDAVYDGMGYVHLVSFVDFGDGNRNVFLGPGKSVIGKTIFDFSYHEGVAADIVLKNAKLECHASGKALAVYNLD